MKRCFQAKILIFTVLIGVAITLISPDRAFAAPGLCTGVVCADEITRSAKITGNCACAWKISKGIENGW